MIAYKEKFSLHSLLGRNQWKGDLVNKAIMHYSVVYVKEKVDDGKYLVKDQLSLLRPFYACGSTWLRNCPFSLTIGMLSFRKDNS